MKNLIYYAIIVISIITIVATGYLFYQKTKPQKTYDVSGLPTITVNGQEFKTDGAIPTADELRQKSFNETVRLASSLPISTSQFAIEVSQYGAITFKVSNPFEANKEAALKWLSDNGYADIDPGQITFQQAQ